MRYETLVSVAVLAEHLEDPRWIVVDCRHDLMNPPAGSAAYREGHLPGAIFLSVDDDLAAPKTGRNGRHPLPGIDAFASRIGAVGVDATKQVVVYDAQGGMPASRLWWMLRWLGHDAVALLDGGFPAWVEAGHTITREVPTLRAARFVPRPRAMSVDITAVQAQLGRADYCMIDARAADRYRGENEIIDPVAGHIPGALNRFWGSNLDGKGRFKSPELLRSEFVALIGDRHPATVIHGCGSGVSACHNLLAMELAGLSGSLLYPGSWSEWCADPARPIALGPEP